MSKHFLQNGSEIIRTRIDEAIARGECSATVTEDLMIGEAVRIPSNFTLILDGCELRQADGVYANIFINEHNDTPLGKTAEGRDHDIRILGRRGAVLDGGNYNNLHEKNAGKDGLPPIWKNNMILFSNVERFEVSGIACRNQRWWALCFLACSHGRIADIDFCACDIGIDENGIPYHGLKRDKYSEILVKNADGIDLRLGCHDIVIENITGFTEDDTVALTALPGNIEKQFVPEGEHPEISHVAIRRIHASAHCSIVRLLNQGGTVIHDITVEDVRDTSLGSPHMERGIYAVRIGDGIALYSTRHATPDETYNISVKGVLSRALHSIHLGGGMSNVTYENVTVFDQGGDIEDMRS